MIRVLVSLLSFVPLLASLPAEAQESSGPEIVAVRVGFSGSYAGREDAATEENPPPTTTHAYKAGLWTPVEVTCQGEMPADAELVLTVPDGDGVPSRVIARWAQASPGESRNRFAQAYIRPGRVRSQLEVGLHSAGKQISKRTFRAGVDFPPATPSEKGVVLVIGAKSPEPFGVEEAVRLLSHGGRRRSVVVPLAGCNQLPTQWYGYEGVDAVVLLGGEPEAFAGLDASSLQLAALREWVQMGGRLVLCAGSEAEPLIGPGGPLEPFLPGRLDEMVWLRKSGTLEAYTASAVSLSSGRGRFELRVPLLTDVDGAIEAHEGNLPLVIRSAHGFGQVAFLALDPSQAPLNTWPDRGQLLAQLLSSASGGGDDPDENAALMHFGYTDMSGQLRSALDRFEEVRPVPFWLVVGLILLYMLAIGPGDYFFLKKVVRRMEFTWITFPLCVVGVAVAAYLLAGHFKGDQVRVNGISLVDVDAASGRVRGTAWANVFSPRMDSYNLTFQPSLSDGGADREARMLVGWLGLPGSALGGMDPKTADSVPWREHYDFAPRLDALEGVPIPVWSTRSLTARWSATTDACPTADLVEKDDVLAGTITNTLDFPLDDCLLAYGRWAYPLGTLEPGQVVELGPDQTRRELKSLLTGRKMVYDEAAERFTQRSTPYDQASVDPAYVVRAMTFFDEADGRRYTGLVNRYQQFVDLSPLLGTNRTVLLAQGPAGADASGFTARLLHEDEPLGTDGDHNPTVYRFVFSVGDGSTP